MKKLLFATLLASASIAANGADLKPYIEASAGYARLDSTDWKNLLDGTHGDDNNNLFTAASLETKSKSTWNAGLELGLKDIIIPNLRVAISDTYTHANRKLKGSLTTNAGTENVDDNGKSSMHLMLINAYYDFKTDSALTPFVGVGLGAAKSNAAEDAEFAWALHGGAKYSITSNIYAGVKASYFHVNELKPKDNDLGSIRWDDTDSYAVNATLGYEF